MCSTETPARVIDERRSVLPQRAVPVAKGTTPGLTRRSSDSPSACYPCSPVITGLVVCIINIPARYSSNARYDRGVLAVDAQGGFRLIWAQPSAVDQRSSAPRSACLGCRPRPVWCVLTRQRRTAPVKRVRSAMMGCQMAIPRHWHKVYNGAARRTDGTGGANPTARWSRAEKRAVHRRRLPSPTQGSPSRRRSATQTSSTSMSGTSGTPCDSETFRSAGHAPRRSAR